MHCRLGSARATSKAPKYERAAVEVEDDSIVVANAYAFR
jgi:hypothetical protein